MITLNVGLSKKVGLPNYSSLGADCHLSLELPGDLLDHPEALRQRIQTAYAITAEAVAGELARQAQREQPPAEPPAKTHQATSQANGHVSDHTHQAVAATRRETAATVRKPEPDNGPGTRGRGMGPATEKQRGRIAATCRRLRIDMEELLKHHGVYDQDDLTVRTASDIIDELTASERPINAAPY